MKTRNLLLSLVVLLVVAAFAVERLAPHVPSIRSGATETTGGGPGSRGDPADSHQSPHEFAILEIGIGEVPTGRWRPRFRLSVTEGDRPPAAYDIAPIDTGFVEFGPLAAGAEVAVSVVVGGAICGFDEEETIGEARVRIAGSLGRQFVIVPVRAPSLPPPRHRVEVVDPDEWAVEGARLVCEGTSAEALTSRLGYARFDAAGSARVRVVPPASRPDLLETEVALDAKYPMTLVTLAALPAREIEIAALTEDLAREPIDRIRIEPVDSRHWRREYRVQGGRADPVAIGTYRASWDVAGAQRSGLLTVTRDRVLFEESLPPVRLRRVEVGGSWQAFATAPMKFVVLAGRNRERFLLPSRILGSPLLETFNGLNHSSFGRIGSVQDDGRVVFAGVAPGVYEFEIAGRPRYASLCLVVPDSGDAEVVSRVAHPVSGVGTLYGALSGPAKSKPYHVEVRAAGQFQTTASVEVGESYEFDDLSPGVYAVRVCRADAMRVAMSTGKLPASAWRNVIVDAGLRVKLDFAVE